MFWYFYLKTIWNNWLRKLICIYFLQCVVEDNVAHHARWFWFCPVFIIKVLLTLGEERVLNLHCSGTSCGQGTVLSAYFDHLYFHWHVAWPVYGMHLVLKMGFLYALLYIYFMKCKKAFLLDCFWCSGTGHKKLAIIWSAFGYTSADLYFDRIIFLKMLYKDFRLTSLISFLICPYSPNPRRSWEDFWVSTQSTACGSGCRHY